MDPATVWPLIAVIVVGAYLWLTLNRRRAERAREGRNASAARPDEARAVRRDEARSGREAEAEAVRREDPARRAEEPGRSTAPQPQSVGIRSLSAEERADFGDRWRGVQTQFVEDPRGAVTHADRLVGEAMTTRGYPVWDFEKRVDDFAADHPDVVINYRAARDIAAQHQRGQATTDDLRQAMVHYRALFLVLLGPEAGGDARAPEERARPDVHARR